MRVVRRQLWYLIPIALASLVLVNCGGSDNPVSPAPNRPFNPVPADGAYEVRPDALLSWRYNPTNPDDGTVYDVYYGTGSTLIPAGTNLADTLFTPPLPWADNTTYRWKVVARETDGITNEGPIWHFTTVYGGTWVRSYPQTAPSPRLYRALELSDGTIIAAGESVTNENTSEMLMLHLDQDGVLLWDSLYTDLRLSADLALGTSDAIITVGYLGNRGIAARLDKSGNLSWTRSYGTNSSRFDAVILPSAGGYLFGGTHWKDASAEAWLVRTDDEGTVIWNMTYGTSSTADSLFDLVETSDGGFAFCGVSGSTSLIVHTNAIGVEQWRYVGTTGTIRPAVSLVQDSDSTLTVFIMKRLSPSSSFDPELRRFRVEDGALSVGFDLPGYAPVRRGQIIADDDLGVTVVYTALSDFMGGDGSSEAMRLVRLSPLGTRLWTVDYNPNDPTWGNGLLQLAEGNYLAVGATRSSPTADIEPIIVKTTFDGTQHPE
ncbi:MAG: hypothetical protein V2A56_07860 [bacterium]